MNLIGKIFVVVIFVLSLVFMSLSMAVYATHKNWRTEVEAPKTGLQDRLKETQSELSKLKDEKNRLLGDLTKELDAKRSALTAAESKLLVAQKHNTELEAQKAETERLQREAIAANTSAQINTTTLRKEVDRLREEVAKAYKEREMHFNEYRKLSTQYDNLTDEKRLLERRAGDLVKDLSQAEKLRIMAGLPKNADVSKIPPKVEAVVTSVVGGGLVEISLGSDAGLQVGHVLEVYRVGSGRSDYVGRIDVVRTEPNKSACKVDPKFLKSNIQVNDRVVSKIN